jgi:hypothetical protein
VRGATDRELRSLAGSGLRVAVIAPAADGPVHSRAVADRLAGLTGGLAVRVSDGTHRAFGLGVLTVTDAGIARILVFGGGADLLARFGLPPVHSSRGRLTSGGGGGRTW